MYTHLDIMWILFSAVLVLIMQGGFLALESGLTRSKNAINVAMKNITDLIIAVILFWVVGFGLMFGKDVNGLIGSDKVFIPLGEGDPWTDVFFFFQAMFCATTVTIISGAVAERTKFWAYALITVLVTVLIYPVFGHWAWGSLFTNESGWLEQRGFIDFAGSTVVHSVGGWVALAAVITIGPRIGRFEGNKVNEIPSSNLPLAMLGVLLFFVGWIGFNGGSTLEFSEEIPGIVINTILAGLAGSAISMIVGKIISPTISKSILPLNGALAGLVAITASCHIVNGTEAFMIGAVGGIFMLICDRILIKFKIDDAVGAVPVHLAAGIWGTIAVALFGKSLTIGEVDMLSQLMMQLKGIIACGIWSFGVTYIILRFINRKTPLRVKPEDEHIGLNVAMHDAKSAIYELLETIEHQRTTQDLSVRAKEEPFTEVGQIATRYNRLLDILENVNRRTHKIISDIKDGIITFTHDGRLLSLNPGAERLLHVEEKSVVGRPISNVFERLNFISPNFDWENIFKSDKHTNEFLQAREIIGPGDGDGNSYIEITTTESLDAKGNFYTAVVRDVTEKRRIEELLIQQKEQAQVTLESLGEGVITTDYDGLITYLNPVAEDIIGYRTKFLKGKFIDDVLNLSHDNMDEKISIGDIQKSGSLTNIMRFNSVELKLQDDTSVIINLSASPIWNRTSSILGSADTIGSVIVFQDVSKAYELERLLSYQATHDTITGLLNRREFERRLQELILDTRSDKSHHVMCYVDLDQFKIVNDTCGHNAGDELLRQLGNLLAEKMRTSDTFARLGGDEFGILLDSCSIEKGVSIANDIRESIESHRFTWDDNVFSVGASIGVVGISQDAESSVEVMCSADAACYVAKDGGRNRVHLHEKNDTELVRQRGHMHWASRIQQAIDEDRLRLYYQPIVAAQEDEEDIHCEIFVRMIDELGDMVPPGAFIPAAERYNFMSTIDKWVIENTFECLRNSPDHYKFAINLSGGSINSGEFLKFVKKQLRKSHINAEQICFEITETAAISNLNTARKFIEEIKVIGCKFSLDDFGSGLSSFGYLKSLPVDFLKIDGQFVRDLLKDQIDYAMVKSINDVGHIIGIKTIAEYVENESIKNELVEMGVDYLQGYYTGEPKPLEEIEFIQQWLR